MSSRGRAWRARLAKARLMLVFTPTACPPGSDPWQVLAHALPELDVVQVRVKDPENAQTPARALCAAARRVLDLVRQRGSDALVLVNDRVDVARVLGPLGCAGVHLGADDAPVSLAREILGPEALIGLSTHSTAEVLGAAELALDYLGFGPIHPTATKGYTLGLCAEAAWSAARSISLPVFPIGGIDESNVSDLAGLGRAAVGAAILRSCDPRAAAHALRELLEEP